MKKLDLEEQKRITKTAKKVFITMTIVYLTIIGVIILKS